MNVRAHAALTLAPVIKGEQSLQSSFDAAALKVDEKDRGLFHELVYGSLRQYEWLHGIFRLLVSKKLKNKDSDVLALILIGIYQLQYLRVPDHAAISETVNATKKLKKHWAKGLVNATLRNFLRQRNELISKVEQQQTAQYRLPQWLLEKLQHDWPESWQTLSKSMLVKPPVTLRNNAQAQDRDALQAELTSMEIGSQLSQWGDQGLTLVNSADVNRIQALKEGRASVQDEAAQLAARLLELKAGQRVLDACAAPGGKTCHILETEAELDVTALEFDPIRAAHIRENLDRLKLDATIKIGDATNLNPWWDNTHFDRILLDAPCSATGVIRRHPDIKLLRRETDLAKLAQTQQQILQTIWQCLAPGGILVYATCSILKQENEEVVAAFCQTQTDAVHIDIDAEWGQGRAFGRQLLTQESGHDGFYYAKLQKVK